MQPTLIDQGLNLMLFGMGTVFVFLTILVFATTLMSRIVQSLSSSEPEADPPTSSTRTGSSPSPQIVEAIRKAIAAHRQA